MEKMVAKKIERMYQNAGQHAEQVAEMTLTGKCNRADNISFAVCGDCGQYQIKGARATVCKGTDIDAHLKEDKATAYIYVSADFTTLYVMSKNEYKQFVQAFGTVTRESEKNGGAVKTRLKSEGQRMKAWLDARA